MSEGAVIWTIFGGFTAFFITCFAAPFWAPRAIIALFPLAFPEARAIAELIHRRPDNWRSDDLFLRCEAMRISRTHYTVYSTLGEWKPGHIEKIIIGRAVTWRCDTYVKVMMRPMLDRELRGALLPRD